ncbi:MAG: UDP-2,3-diacylglucosamine diphosphatase [Phycisphaerales bacterium]|jgi:UDP-2,3-diacylglucosamine pyrophosphatase LpxH
MHAEEYGMEEREKPGVQEPRPETIFDADPAEAIWTEPAVVRDETTGAERLDLRYRTIFLSDLHLGSNGCQAKELSAFLKSVRCDTLYLVGDVIDMWRLKSKWYWPGKHNRVISRILKMARKGTRVVYIPGNHDEGARQYAGLSFGGVELVLDAEHVTADGRRLFISHGDQFDMVVKHARALSMLGSASYELLLRLNRQYNRVRRLFGLEYWSLSQFLKLKVKSACTYISRFEEALVEEAKGKGFDGVVCGHIHKAEIRPDDNHQGMMYYNCGDWVESCTALVEDFDGSIRLLDGKAVVERLRQYGQLSGGKKPRRVRRRLQPSSSGSSGVEIG